MNFYIKYFCLLNILLTIVTVNCFSQEIRTSKGKYGKLVLINGNVIEGVIECKDKQCYLIRFKDGVMTFDKSEVKKIIYNTQKKVMHNSPVYRMKSEKTYSPYHEQISKYAYKYNVSPALVSAVMKAESNYNVKDVSCKGAKGLMQLMPSTAKGLGVDDIFDPEQNVGGGVRYLSYLLDTFGNDFDKSVAAYNAGPNAVKKYEGIPPYKETKGYVKTVKKYYSNYNNFRGIHSFKDEKTGKLYFYTP